MPSSGLTKKTSLIILAVIIQNNCNLTIQAIQMLALITVKQFSFEIPCLTQTTRSYASQAFKATTDFCVFIDAIIQMLIG